MNMEARWGGDTADFGCLVNSNNPKAPREDDHHDHHHWRRMEDRRRRPTNREEIKSGTKGTV